MTLSCAASTAGVLRESALAASDGAEHARELDRILTEGAVHSVYQPIVELNSGVVVAFEALARGPQGSPLERPDLLFAAARRERRLLELDHACQAAALRGALVAGLTAPTQLFVNAEPATVAAAVPPAIRELMAALGDLPIVVELTERALTDRPAEVISAVRGLREQGAAVALDDVGADPRSLALMPFVAPEVVKLDLRLVQDKPSDAVAAVVHAVNAYAERSGAVVLAEGIETPEHVGIALALGARYGQGWLYGRPGPLPEQGENAPGATLELPARARGHEGETTPFAVVTAARGTRRGTKSLLLAISRHLEAQALARGDAAVLLATFQDLRHLTPATRRRYRELARTCAFVGALGGDVPPEPEPGVRGAELRDDEPLRGEWNVVVLDPHFAAAFVAQDIGDRDRPDMERRFDFCLTYDRELVTQAAEALMRRIARAG